jgi:integrase
VRALKENRNVGRALSRQDEQRLIGAIGACRAPALYPLFVLALDAGLRASELRFLCHQDLRLTWRDGFIAQGVLTVAKSKTEAGTGRTIPLTSRACAALSLWLSRFPNAQPEHYIFPRHAVGFAGNGRTPFIYNVDLDRPMNRWKRAWELTRRRAGLRYRWHDLRHSFVTRLAENPGVSEQTIRALAGHVSQAMFEHYSHIRADAKLAAMAALERGTKTASADRQGAQFGAQSPDEMSEQRSAIPEKALN